MNEYERLVLACIVIDSEASRKHLAKLKAIPTDEVIAAVGDYVRAVKKSWPKRFRDLNYILKVSALIDDVFVSIGLNAKTKNRYTIELTAINDYINAAGVRIEPKVAKTYFMRIKHIASAVVKANAYRRRQEKMMEFINSIPVHRLNKMVGSMSHRDYRAYRYFNEFHKDPSRTPKEQPLPKPFRFFAYMPTGFSAELYSRYLKLVTLNHSMEVGVSPTAVAMLFPLGFINHLRKLVENKLGHDQAHIPWLTQSHLTRAMVNLNSDREVSAPTISVICDYLSTEYSYETTIKRTTERTPYDI